MTSISYDSKFMRQIIFLFNRATIAPVIGIKRIIALNKIILIKELRALIY